MMSWRWPSNSLPVDYEAVEVQDWRHQKFAKLIDFLRKQLHRETLAHTQSDAMVIIGGAHIKKSHHSFINPAITITLRSGSRGQGIPPLVSVDGALCFDDEN